MSSSPKVVLNTKQLELTLKRLCLEIIENYPNISELALIGMQPRGVVLARELKKILKDQFNINGFDYGELDITFYRDDFRRNDKALVPNELNINFNIEDKRVLLVDDVLFTGRSVRAALDALADFGRPKTVELMTLIDRRYNRELPIEADYTGQTVDTRGSNLMVSVLWSEKNAKVVLKEK